MKNKIFNKINISLGIIALFAFVFSIPAIVFADGIPYASYGAYTYTPASSANYGAYTYTPASSANYGSYSQPAPRAQSTPTTNYGTCNGCGRTAGSASCTGCGTSSRSTPTTYSQPRSGGNFINDLLDLSFGFSSVKNDNDTTIKTDSHNKTSYSVNNTDNSDRSVRTNYTYTDNSEVDNSVRISSGRHVAVNDDDDDDDDNDNDDLNVICRVSDSSVDEGDTVSFTADISGGDSPYEYDWRGDIDGDDKTETFRFNREGRYEVEIRVTDDDGNTDTDDCPVVVVDDEDNDDDDNNVNLITTTTSNPPTGNLASLNSVFLSQVPYTGSKETLTIIGYVATIFVWSVLVVYFLARRKSKMLKSSIIDSFKKGNKVAVKIG